MDDSKNASTAVEEQTRPQTTIALGEIAQTAAPSERRAVSAFDCMSYSRFARISDIQSQWAIYRSEEFTASMAFFLTPSTAICVALFAEIRKPDFNSVSDHTEGARWARCHRGC